MDNQLSDVTDGEANAEDTSTRSVSGPKKTAGSGYSYEDEVVAFFLVWLLRGTHPISGIAGPITQVSTQKVREWPGFDDLVLYFEQGGQQVRCALSIKSSPQVTRKSVPTDFVQAAWKMLLHEETNAFNPALDWLGMICPPHDTLRDLNQLIRYAHYQTEVEFKQNVFAKGYASEEARSLLRSLACPAELAKDSTEGNCSPYHLLQKLSIIGLDLDFEDSKDRAQAVTICQELLTDGTHQKALLLWSKLCRIGNSYRIANGDCTRNAVLNKIHGAFDLRDLPDYSGDWIRLEAASKSAMSTVRSVIADGISLDRTDEVIRVKSAVEESVCTVLIGPSGTGKTVVARQVCEMIRSAHVVWIDAARVEPGFLEAMASRCNLQHPIQEVLTYARHCSGLLVVDGTEKLTEENKFDEVGRLLSCLGLDKQDTVWRALLVCRAEQWERVLNGIARALDGWAEWNTVSSQIPDFDLLQPVWKRFPSLRQLAARPHLSGILRNLKVLDAIARALLQGHKLPAREWAGETQLVGWYWTNFVRTGPSGAARSSLLQHLSAQLADAGKFEIAETELSAGDLSLIHGLSDILKSNPETGTIRFEHDLLSDWSRFQALRPHLDDLKSHVSKRLANPHWHGALRLLGIYLLDADASGNTWKATLNELPEARDTLLEALVFSHNPEVLLESAWSTLREDDGRLLENFLKRFRFVASMPNPSFIQLALEVGIPAYEARTMNRLPMWPYWIPVLRFLRHHLEKVVEIVPLEVARISHAWLHFTPSTWPTRKQAASLALGVAWEAFRTRPYVHPSEAADRRLCYQAALEAYPDIPDEVRQLALKSAARLEPAPEDGEAYDLYDPPGTIKKDVFFGGDEVVQDPWPDGPLFRVHEPFAEACLQTDALDAIIEIDPQLAQELVLATLIEVRPPKRQFEQVDPLGFRDEGIDNFPAFYPAFYTRGPFLKFLRSKPDTALSTIVRLVDFATDRYVGAAKRRKEKESFIRLRLPAGEKSFVGDDHIYHWYRGVWGVAPIASALMAVEKWLYDLVDAGEPIAKWLSFLLTESHSAAFLGMLAEVGRYAPRLFLDELQPLLLSLQIYGHEDLAERQSLGMFGIPFSFRDGQRFFELAQEWSTMKHRQRKLIEIATHRFHSDKEMQAALMAAAREWHETLTPEDERLTHLAKYLEAWFDPANWKEADAEGVPALVFNLPNKLLPSEEDRELEFVGSSSYFLPLRCRQILDSKDELAEDNIPELLSVAKKLHSIKVSDLPSSLPQNPANAVCGVAAVLVIKAQQWLNRHPSEKQWCEGVIKDTLAYPPPWPNFDIPESIGSWTWEHFLCDAVPVLWAGNPDNPTWRSCAARLIFAKHYAAASLLMRHCFELREALGPSFWQLVDLMLEWAAKRWEIVRAHAKGDALDVAPWAKKLIKQFSVGRVSRVDPNWGERAVKDGVIRRSGHQSGAPHGSFYYVEPAIALVQVHSTFQDVLQLSQALDARERGRFQKFWGQALVVALSKTRFYDRDQHSAPLGAAEAEIPTDYENWVLEKIPLLIAEMEPNEHPEELWKAILRPGPSADLWVGRFLSAWFHEARNVCQPDCFVEYWRGMFSFCETCSLWTKPTSFSHELPRLWLQLVGFPRFSKGVWLDEDRGILASVADLFVRAMDHILPGSYEIARLLDWACSPIAKSLRLSMLEPLALFAVDASGEWWQKDELAQDVARYLYCLWNDHQSELKKDAISLGHFRKLLQRAASLHIPLALELQKTIGSQST